MTTARRLRDFIIHALGQVRTFKKIYPGVMHFLLFWGVTIQVVGTAINLMQMQLFIPFVELSFPRGALYFIYELVMDLAGIAILIGILMAAFRRGILRPKALETRPDDTYALLMLGLLPLAGYFLEATRLVATAPTWAAWSPIGNLIAGWLSSTGMTVADAVGWHNYLIWVHAILALIFAASIPFTKLRHLVYAPLNVILHPLRQAGAIEKIENIEETESLGVGKVSEFNATQLLSLDTCVNCGRCQEVCPAAISGLPLNPRSVVQALHENMIDSLIRSPGRSTGNLTGEIIPEKAIWSCTTCGACQSRCPVFVNPIDEIIELRRYQALTTGKLPKSVADTLRNLERQGNPWGIPANERITWTAGSSVRELVPGEQTDVLLYMGCAYAFDQRNRKAAQSFIRVLNKAGVDFAILGLDESCCGETARRLGNEYLFQTYAQQNIETFNQVKFKRIVTPCPHCYNTLKNEYPQMGGNYTVQHYTEFLAEISLPWDTLSLDGKGIKSLVTYHDSCYLGRYNQVYSQPRQLLNQAHIKTVEMHRRKENSFCCGGGGGGMWMETDPSTRINQQRLMDVLKVKSELVATACPYCLLMFDDAIRSKGLGEQVQVLDITEILDKQLSS